MAIEQSPTKITLNHPSGSSCTLLLFGATIISWKTKEGKERLFLSKKSLLDGSKAVRGGIPLVFPIFGKINQGKLANLAQHGFIRNHSWIFENIIQDDHDRVSISLDSETTRSIWPYAFHLRYVVSLTQHNLQSSIEIMNNSKESFDFHVLFHTYFDIPDIFKLKIHGLSGLQYRDKTRNGDTFLDDMNILPIVSETDRVYMNTPERVIIHTGDTEYGNICVDKTTFKDTVVWNPWVNGAIKMNDFGPDDAYKNMICVEVGSVANFITLSPSEKWQASQILSIQ